MPRFRASIALFAMAGLLTGCEQIKTADQKFDARMAQADTLTMKKPDAVQTGGVVTSPLPMLGVLEVPSSHGDPLPSRCRQMLTLQISQPMTLQQLVGRLSQELKIPVELDPRVYNDPEDKPSQAASTAGIPAGVANANAYAQGTGRQMGMAGAVVSPATLTVTPNFSGSCEEVLDQIASNFDVHWTMAGKTLAFDKYVSRTMFIRASDAISTSRSSMTSGGNSSGGGGGGGGSGGSSSASQNGGSTQTATLEIKGDIWSDIDSTIKSMMPKGSRYSLSRSAGTLWIMTTPRVANEVQSYVDQMNAVLSTTVSVEVTALYITVDNSDNYGLDLSAVYQAGQAGGISAGLSSLVPTLSTTGGTGSVGVLSPPVGSDKNNFSTHFAGSKIMASAVSSKNRLADLRTATLTGRNGVATPIVLTTNQDIVRSLTAAVGLQTGTSQISATTDTINYGFTLTVLPRVISPGVVNVFLNFSANDLTNLTNFAIGTSGSVELSTIENRSFWTEMPLKSGQTLVLCGTEQDKVTRLDQGQGVAENFLAGGQKNGEVIRTRLILLVTPTILATPK